MGQYGAHKLIINNLGSSLLGTENTHDNDICKKHLIPRARLASILDIVAVADGGI